MVKGGVGWCRMGEDGRGRGILYVRFAYLKKKL